MAVLYYVSILQGKKDKSGHHARMLLGGVNLGHLEKTTLTYIKEDLLSTNTPYAHDKKNNKFTVGTVTIILVSLSDPGSIVGFDCVVSLLDEIDDLNAGDDVTFEAIRAVNERTRQNVRGFRTPFVASACLDGNQKVLTSTGKKKIKYIKPGELVMTRYGFRRVKQAGCTGVKKVIRKNGILLTKEHLFADGVGWKSAERLDKTSLLTVYSNKGVLLWKKLEQVVENLRLILTAEGFTGQSISIKNKGILEQTLQMVKQLRFTVLFGRKQMGLFRTEWRYTIKILTHVITILKTLSALQAKSTKEYIGKNTVERLHVLNAEQKLQQKVPLQTNVQNAKKTNEENKTGYEASLYEKESIQACGKKKKRKSFVWIVMRCFTVLVPCVLDAIRVKIKDELLWQVKERQRKTVLRVLETMHVDVEFVKETFGQQDLLLHAVKNAETELRKLLSVQQSRLTSQRQYALVVRCIDTIVNTIRTNAPPVQVYDLEIDVPEGEEGEYCASAGRRSVVVHNSTSQGQRGLYRVITNFKKSGVGYVLIRGSSRENYYHPPGYIESLYKTYNDREKRVYLEGYFEALAQGRVFGDFDWDKNYANVPMDREIGATERIIWAQDFNAGYHRGCVGVLRGGIIYIVKRYEFPDIREAPKVVRHDFPHNKIIWVPDATAKDQIIQFTRELHKYGIWWVIRSKNVSREDSAFLVNKLLYTGRLICTQAAQDTAEAMSLAVRDKNNQIPAGVGPSCVTADTRVLTKRGMIRIDSVIGGKDYALTRSGWRLVNAAFKTGYKEVGYFDSALNCTKDHPIKYGVTETFAGDLMRLGKYDSLSKKEIIRWTRLGTLECLVEQMEQKLNLLLGMAAFGNEQSTQVTNTHQKRNIFTNFLLRGKHLGYTLQCGKSIMVLFLTTVLYTTKISTASITILKILNVLISVNTQKYMPEDFMKRTQVLRQSGVRCQEQPAQHTIEAQKEEQQKVQVQKNSGRVFLYAAMFVRSAVKRLKKRVYKESLSTVRIHVTTVQKQQELGHEKVEVWCMNVADEHEFFAECAFVSNSPIHDCDAVRMLCYFVCVTERSMLDIKRATVARHLAYQQDEPMVEELSDGYAAINPEAVNR